MNKKILLGAVAILLLCSHDMFLKLDNYFLEPEMPAVIELVNGTFENSENTIDRNRMLDVSLVGNGQRTEVDSTQWFEKDLSTYLDFTTGKSGTWIAGVSTAPRNIAMEAERFNNYLDHDGVVDMLQYRKDNNELDQDAVEKYSKHVKTIFQVGNDRSEDWKTVLGYPIEFVPLENPYEIHAGHDLEVRLLLRGKPLQNQLVLIGNQEDHQHAENGVHSHDDGEEHSHDDNEGKEHSHDDLKEVRTDENGIVKFNLDSSGVWYLKTIHMEKSAIEGLTHESNWATLTFQAGTSDHSHDNVSHSHDTAEHDHHDHENEGIPSYVFWIGSFVLVGILFFLFNKKK